MFSVIESSVDLHGGFCSGGCRLQSYRPAYEVNKHPNHRLGRMSLLLLLHRSPQMSSPELMMKAVVLWSCCTSPYSWSCSVPSGQVSLLKVPLAS